MAIGGPSVVQTATITASVSGTFSNPPVNGDLLIAIGFNAATTIGCATGWTAIKHVSANYVDAQDCYRIASSESATQTPFTGTASNIGGEIWEINGQAASGFIDAQTSGESTTPLTLTLTFAPLFSSDLIVGASAINTKLAGTIPLGFTGDASSAPNGSTGFSDLAAHQANALAGTVAVTWAYVSLTDTHPVTAMMIAIDGSGGTATPSPSPSPAPSPTPTPVPTPTPIGGAFSIVQTGTITSSLGTQLRSAPANGDLLVAIGFNGKSSLTCAANWIVIRAVNGNYDKGESCYRIANGDTAAETPFAGTAANVSGQIWELGGQLASGFIDAQTGGEAGPRTNTLTFAPTMPGDIIVGASAINTKLTGITPANFTTDNVSAPSGSSGFSDLAAHQTGAAAGSQSVTWAYNSTTDTHPVTAIMVAVAGNSASSTPTPSPPPVDWTTMGFDLQRSGYNPNETAIGAGNIASVHKVWTHNVGGEVGEPVYASNVSINGAPVNVLYASGTSQEVAMNADTGAVLWTHALGSVTYQCAGSTSSYTFGASGAPAIDRATNRIYVPDGAAAVHALDLSTGAEASGWPISIASPANSNFVYSAVTFNPSNKMLYTETSSTCDISPWFGRITAINTATAAIANTFYPAQGASGGGIWGFGGASIDPSTNNVYIAVGNGDTTNGGSQTAGYSEQLVSLSFDLSAVLGHYYAPLPTGLDNDFGATPLLFQPPGCQLLAAAVNKSGLFVLYSANNISAGPLQTIQMSITSDTGDFVGVPAYDPLTNYVYVGLPATQGIYKPGLAAFSMQSNCTLNPVPVWNANFGADGALLTADDTPRSPISIANGVVYVSDYQTSVTYAFNAATGVQLWSQPLSANGVVGPIVVNGHLFTSDISGTINAWTL